MAVEISAIGKTGEMFGVLYELLNGSGDFIEEIKKLIKSDNYKPSEAYISTLGSIASIVNAAIETMPGTMFVGEFNFLALINDIFKAREAMKAKNSEKTILFSLSIISDIANIVSMCPFPQVKMIAISVSLAAIAIRRAYEKRKEIYEFLKDLGSSMSHLNKEYQTNLSNHLNRPNIAFGCYVTNGHRGLMHKSAYSQNRLSPHSWGTAGNQHRTPTQRPLTANEMRIKQQLISYAREHSGPAYLYPDFEWKKPGVFELRANRK